MNQQAVLNIIATHTELYRAVAQEWVLLARAAIRARGKFCVALTGGNTPRELYRLLASDEYAKEIDWSATQIYLGDERYVPQDHPDSNFGMATATLLNHVPIPASQIYPMPTQATASECANDYAQTLQRTVAVNAAGIPVLDLILLGMGEDGHIASLFPGADALDVHDRICAAVFVPHLAAWRLTLTYPVITAARQRIIMLTGNNKAKILAQVLSDKIANDLPMQRIALAAPTTWYLDTAAASELPRNKT
jgi:6-phosphogluconolactonase